METGVRKISTFIEEIHIEGGKPAEKPITMVVVAAVHGPELAADTLLFQVFIDRRRAAGRCRPHG